MHHAPTKSRNTDAQWKFTVAQELIRARVALLKMWRAPSGTEDMKKEADSVERLLTKMGYELCFKCREMFERRQLFMADLPRIGASFDTVHFCTRCVLMLLDDKTLTLAAVNNAVNNAINVVNAANEPVSGMGTPVDLHPFDLGQTSDNATPLTEELTKLSTSSASSDAPTSEDNEPLIYSAAFYRRLLLKYIRFGKGFLRKTTGNWSNAVHAEEMFSVDELRELDALIATEGRGVVL